jgi:imidazolonepropionase-like amidohydrolase
MPNGINVVIAERLFDGTGKPLAGKSYVAIQNGRILEVGPIAALAARIPDDVPREEFPNCTIMPGLIDTHVHLTFSASPAPLKQLQTDSDFALLLRAASNARSALQAGITTTRDLGSRNGVMYELRNAIASGIVPGPRLLCSGRPITCSCGHLHFLGGVAEGVEAVTKLACEIVEEGADVIKIIATGGNMTAGSDPLKAQYSHEELSAIVSVAKDAGLPVTVHARGVEGMRASVAAGVNGIEHARMEVGAGEWRFDDELAREMADRGVVAAPTMAASFRALQCQAAGKAVGVRAGAVPIEIRQQNARRLRESGVPVVTGTDAGAALARFEEAINLELELLVGAGWTPAEALQAGTLNAARALRLDKEVGSLEAGKFADMVIVRGDPTRNISDTRQVERVYQSGRCVVGSGQAIVDARPHPWPLNEIAERPSLMSLF